MLGVVFQMFLLLKHGHNSFMPFFWLTKTLIQERFSDFNVTEIQLDGKLVTLQKQEGETKNGGGEEEAKKK